MVPDNYNGIPIKVSFQPFSPNRYYEEYLRQLGRFRGLKYEERPKKVFNNVIMIYGQELLAELKTGAMIWLPAMFGTIEFGVYKGYIPVARVQNAEPSFWVHTTWRKRDKLKYAELFKLRTTDMVGRKLKNFYVDHVDEMNKLKQL